MKLVSSFFCFVFAISNISCAKKDSVTITGSVSLCRFEGNTPSYYLYSELPFALNSSPENFIETSVPVAPEIIELAFTDVWIWGYWKPSADKHLKKMFNQEQLIMGYFALNIKDNKIHSGMTSHDFLNQFPQLSLTDLKPCFNYYK